VVLVVMSDRFQYKLPEADKNRTRPSASRDKSSPIVAPTPERGHHKLEGQRRLHER
jgi:hypothetical protein